MKNRILLLILLMLTFQKDLLTQHWLTENYPFKTGNIFLIKRYIYSSGSGSYTTYSRSTVIKDTLVNSREYFLIDNYYDNLNKMWRVDTLSGNLFMLDPANACPIYGYEKQFDSLWASKNDTSNGCGSQKLVCVDTSNYTIFDIICQSKRFYLTDIFPFGFSTYSRTYVKNFGLAFYQCTSYVSWGWGGTIYTLIGCVINGIIYGDTTIPIGVKKISNSVPNKSALEQNYPNPFNPVTNIRFQIEGTGYVKLIVYDIQGREIMKFFDEKLNNGVYSVDFSGNDLSSGIYFYSLIIDDKIIDTKKMVLIK